MTTVPARLRDEVRQRAKKRCEYCYQPETFVARNHQVEHINPRKYDGPSTLDNLAWACFQCNNTKSSEVAAYDPETGQLTPYFNPRTQTWDEHFKCEDGVILGKTIIGRVTALRLGFNDSDRVETRRLLIKAGLW